MSPPRTASGSLWIPMLRPILSDFIVLPRLKTPELTSKIFKQRLLSAAFMKRPLGIVAVLYAGGLLLGDHFQPPLPCLFATALAFAAAALLLPRFRSLLIWPLIIFTGWTNIVWHTAIVSPNDLRVLRAEQPELTSIRGTLAATP